MGATARPPGAFLLARYQSISNPRRSKGERDLGRGAPQLPVTRVLAHPARGGVAAAAVPGEPFHDPFVDRAPVAGGLGDHGH